MPLPSLFLAHGAPTLPLADTPAREFTKSLGARFPDLKGIVIVSAHWEDRLPTIGTAPTPETIYDFGNFDSRLFEMTYPARTSPELVEALEQALSNGGIAHTSDPERGYDHGVWIPLMLAFPDADVPVVQLSLRDGAPAGEAFALGQALAPLRDQGILVIGSGALVHNLRRTAPEGTPPAVWARNFDDWVVAGAQVGDTSSLLDFLAQHPDARLAHPTPEHLMPFFVALGAGGGATGRPLHRSFNLGTISMTSMAFGAML